MESGKYAELCAHQDNISGQTWISIHDCPLSESTCKLLNRVVPNGTLRGVEGEGKISPIRSWVKRAAVNGVSSNKYFCVPLDSVFAAVYNNFKSGLSKSRLCAQTRANSLTGGKPVWQGLTNHQ